MARGGCRHDPACPVATRSDLPRLHRHLSRRLAGIPWAEIPPTLRDAILFAHHLGVDYIWIDALCILQDQLSDWMKEAAQMASVYRNSLLTLSATSSPDVSAGIFNPAPAQKPS